MNSQRGALSVVIPVYNEADNIEPLLIEVENAFRSRERTEFALEVVYVDDGSTDETRDRLSELRSRYDRLRVVRHRRNYGQSAAILSGVRAARHSVIATLDGDGQNDPADIPRLLEDYLRGFAGGTRLVTGHRVQRRDTWLRRMSSRIANGVRSRLLHDDTPDTGCGLKVFAREDFLALPFFDHMHRFLPALIARHGGRIVSVPVNHRPRTRGKSKYGVTNRLWVGITDLLGVMWLRRRAVQPEIVHAE